MPENQSPTPNVHLHKTVGIDCYDLHLPPEFKMDHHAHLCLVLDGGFTESWDDRSVWCGDGSLRISKPNQGHDLVFGSEPTRCLVFDLQAPYFDKCVHLWQPLTAHTFLQQKTFSALSYRLYTEINRADEASSIVVELLLREILARAAIGRTDRLQPPWLTKVYKTLQKSYREPVCISSMSRVFGIHRVHLNRAFHRHFGCTVSRYVQLLRLEHARHALSTSVLPIAPIAFDAGFTDQSNLTRLFKQQFGLSPAAYRNHRHASVA